MDEYVFYVCRADGVAVMFEVAPLPTEADAVLRAAKMLTDHGSAASITVWRGEQMLHRLDRSPE